MSSGELLWRAVRRHRGRMIAGVLVLSLHQATEAAVPVAIGIFVDRAVASRLPGLSVLAAVVITVASAAGLVAQWALGVLVDDIAGGADRSAVVRVVALIGGAALVSGLLTAAALYFHRLFNPIGMLLMEFDQIQTASAGLARLAGVLEIPSVQEPPDGPAPADASLELVDVGHAYDGPLVLDEVSLRLEPGERVALVGASGAGKTTLAAIAAGVLTPTAGAVRLGGVDVSELGEDRTRAQVALLSQEVHVFSGPLVDDVRLARADATAAEAEAALDRVGALAWVRALPDGLDTVVGESGHQLTGAQAQQVAFARLVLADPPIAVLDEATAEAGSAGARELERASAAATEGVRRWSWRTG